jgi:hypothetical protein
MNAYKSKVDHPKKRLEDREAVVHPGQSVAKACERWFLSPDSIKASVTVAKAQAAFRKDISKKSVRVEPGRFHL